MSYISSRFNVKYFGAVGAAISAGAIVTGNTYTIAAIGTTNFTLIGASSNSVGVAFVATGAGAGTGTVYADDTAAINAAVAAAVAAGGGAIYLPAGTYYTNGIGSVSTIGIEFVGDGAWGAGSSKCVSTLVNTHATAATITLTNGGGTIKNLEFTTNQLRASGNPLLSLSNGGNQIVALSTLQVRCTGDGILATNTSLIIDGLSVKCLTNGGCPLHSIGGLVATNSTLYNVGGNAPTVWIQGTATSLAISNCSFFGAAPKATYAPTSITSNASEFTVGFASSHAFNPGDYMLIAGATPTGYNGYWRVGQTTSTTVTVYSTTNLGTATLITNDGSLIVGQKYQIASLGSSNFASIGAYTNAAGVNFFATATGSSPSPGSGTVSATVYTVPCCMLIDNALGPVNESTIVSTQLGASGYPIDALSVGLYVDGRNGGGEIEGWQFKSSYVDIGRVGVLLAGYPFAGSSTVNRWLLEGLQIEGNAGNGGSAVMLGGIWVEQCPGVSITGCQGSTAGRSPGSKFLYVYSASEALANNWFFGIPAPAGSWAYDPGVSYELYFCYSGLTSSTTQPHLDPSHWTRMSAMPLCDGLTITATECGGPADFIGASGQVCDYGLVFDGSINSFTIIGSVVWGAVAPVENVVQSGVMAITAATSVNSSGNFFYQGVTSPPTSRFVPYFMPIERGVGGTINLTSDQTLPTAVEVTIVWSAAEFDDAGLWSSGSPSLLTIPSSIIRMRITVMVRFAYISTTAGSRAVKLKDNNGNVWAAVETGPSSLNDSSYCLMSPIIDVATQGITWFLVTAEQTSGFSVAVAGASVGGTRLSYEIMR